MKNKIKEAIKELVLNGEPSNNQDWQSLKETVKENNRMIEVKNLYLKFPKPLSDLGSETKADIPWAEDHFNERINGKPINPGKQYKNWPHYKGFDNDELFKKDGIFSHTYMERYWSADMQGRNFRYGDLNDLIYKLELNLYTRQAYLPVWFPEDGSVIDVRVPCTIGYWFNYHKGELHMTYHIRSCDARRHFRNDIYLSYRLLEHVAEKLRVESGNIDVWIGSFHCFESDIYSLNKQTQ